MCKVKISCTSAAEGVTDGPLCWTMQVWFERGTDQAEQHLIGRAEESVEDEQGAIDQGAVYVEVFLNDTGALMAELQMIGMRTILEQLDWQSVHVQVEQSLLASVPGFPHRLPRSVERLYDPEFLKDVATVCLQIDTATAEDEIARLADPLREELRRIEAP